MTKTEIINCILEVNKSAKREFLESFSIEELSSYLDRLMELDLDCIARMSEKVYFPFS